MSSALARTLLGISLLHVTQDQAAGVARLERQSSQGLLLAAGWQRRLPVITDIMPADAAWHAAKARGLATNQLLLIRCEGTSGAQKLLKAFGNRLAALARKPLRFERVAACGLVHLAPAHHHLAACGLQLDGAAIPADATCPSCILLALTPPPTDRDCDYHPGGRTYIEGAELRYLRNHACRATAAGRGK